MIIITAKKEGFRRCGIAHPAKPTSHADDRFSAEQLKTLQGESMLVVQIIAEDGKAAKKTDESDPSDPSDKSGKTKAGK